MTDATCIVDGCTKKPKVKKMCGSHYAREWRGGPVDGPIGGYYRGPAEALANRVRADGDCLVCTGSTNTNGYGQINIKGTPRLAHRLAYELSKGQIPEGMFVDHTCFNRPCVNINHLRLATVGQNNHNRTGPNSNNKVGARNVSRSGSKFEVRLTVNKVRLRLGRYDTLEEAALAAEEARLKHYSHTQN